MGKLPIWQASDSSLSKEPHDWGFDAALKFVWVIVGLSIVAIDRAMAQLLEWSLKTSEF